MTNPESPRVILHTDEPEVALRVVRSAHPDLEVECCASYEGLPKLLAEFQPQVVYSVRFAGTPGFPRDALIGCASLNWLSIGGSGTDHLAGWDPARLQVTNAAGVAAGMMAEYALGGMLSFSLDFGRFARDKQARRWTSGRVEPLQGKHLLILGLGHTGKAVAARAKALGMTVTGVRARPAPVDHVDRVAGMAELPELWGQADYIVCCVPLLPGTRGLVDKSAFAAMKRGAVLVDVSRGGVVEEAALLTALGDGTLKGAALDVFEQEPLPGSHPLWAMENVILTPHCSSVYEGWQARSVEMFAENMTRYRVGEPLQNLVDPARGY